MVEILFVINGDGPVYYIILVATSALRTKLLQNEEPLDLVWYRISSDHDFYTTSFKVCSKSFMCTQLLSYFHN